MSSITIAQMSSLSTASGGRWGNVLGLFKLYGTNISLCFYVISSCRHTCLVHGNAPTNPVDSSRLPTASRHHPHVVLDAVIVG